MNFCRFPLTSNSVDTNSVAGSFKYLWIWVNVTLLHAIIIALLWFPQTLHVPTRQEISQAWQNITLEVDHRWLNPEAYQRQLEAEKLAQQEAAQRVADLPPALLTRAELKGRVYQIQCPKSARAEKLQGSVFMIADISAHGKVEKVTVVEPSPNAEVNQLIIKNFKKASFKSAMDERKQPAPDQVHFSWPYDCR